jgi:hypothetical protein
MSELSQVLAKLESIESRLSELSKPEISPWLRGDQAAAKYAGYKSTRTFRRWAQDNEIKPYVEEGINFWDRASIVRAREKMKRI